MLVTAQQSCNCRENIEYLYKTVRDLPAYKEADNASKFKRAYELALEKEGGESAYHCFQKLSDLLVSLNDRHNSIYSQPQFEVRNGDTIYTEFPLYSGDLADLKKQLATLSEASPEGIYSRDDFAVALVEDEGALLMINLKAGKIWKAGEIMGRLIPYGNNKYLASVGLPADKKLVTFPLEIHNGYLSKFNFRKNPEVVDYENNFQKETYSIRQSEDITYLRIGSFSAYNPLLSEAEAFYDSLEDKEVTSKLIIDLRNNGGGGDRNSDILYKYLKRNYKKSSIYVLVNGATTSNAEQFVIRLKDFENTAVLGRPTSGTIAYELGESYKFPCGNLTGFFTIKKHKEYIEYESVGVQPDVMLKPDADWISQTEAYIQKN